MQGPYVRIAKAMTLLPLNPEDDQIYCIKCDFVEDRPTEKVDKKAKKINVVIIEDYKKNTNKNR